MSYENALEAAAYIRSKYAGEVKTAVVLGSGLGAFADEVENAVRIPYEEIPHFARSTVEGHAGQLVLGEAAGVPVAVQQGRFHYYEGYDMQQVMFPVRTFGVMGIKNLVLTNAAGSLNADLPQGSLMLIRDHLNMLGVNPLRGPNDKRFGPRFPDMSEVYDREFRAIAEEEAAGIASDRDEKNILGSGVYCALSGPTYETPAEIRMYTLAWRRCRRDVNGARGYRGAPPGDARSRYLMHYQSRGGYERRADKSRRSDGNRGNRSRPFLRNCSGELSRGSAK